ncbi:Protein of unknown function [Gryllus bimaculatus]|nr:Protein of unknown function [Gryllus bimaculatus]
MRRRDICNPLYRQSGITMMIIDLTHDKDGIEAMMLKDQRVRRTSTVDTKNRAEKSSLTNYLVPRSTPDHSSTLPPISDHPSTLPPSTSDHPSTPVPFTTDHPNSAGADPWDAAEADAEAEAAAGAAGADADDEDDDPVVERQSSPAQWLSRCARQEHRDLSLHRHSESPLPLETRCLLR